MFNKSVHTIGQLNKSVAATFIESKNIQVFPCGRRRSTSLSTEDDSRIPFDPEARLNTEANNRKHASKNGFTQTYLDCWENNKLTLILAGYLFDVRLASEYNDFGNAVTADGTSVYANILINNTPLFQGTYKNNAELSYSTDILDSWHSENNLMLDALDLPINDEGNDDKTLELDNYYFSGLAFSAQPVATLSRYETDDTFKAAVEAGNFPTKDEYINFNNSRVISLRILDKVGAEWVVHEPAKLPHIEHGADPNSIVVETAKIRSKLTASTVQVNTLSVDNIIGMPSIQASEVTISYGEDNCSKINKDGLNTPQATIGIDGKASDVCLTSKGAIDSKGKITSDESIKAPKLYQTIEGVDKKVPIIELDSLDDGTYQLKISRIGNMD